MTKILFLQADELGKAKEQVFNLSHQGINYRIM